MKILPETTLRDSYGREFHYLRLSVTGRCNFRCLYCLPNGYQRCHQESDLNLSEIRNLVSAFSAFGFWKVRLTGGEPTVRKDIIEIAETVSAVSGITKVALTTNGYRLKSQVQLLKQAGISSLNISIDSLDRERFYKITGLDRLNEILDGLRLALEVGFQEIKINSVLLKDLNDQDLDSFLNFIKSTPVSVRLIELMETGQNTEFFKNHHLPADAVKIKLFNNGWKIKSKKQTDGPALEFEHADYCGTIGIISPYSKDFCKSCNRLRVSSTGGLRLCLFGEKDLSLRPWLQKFYQKRELMQVIRNQIVRKPVSHFLFDKNFGDTFNLSAIGG